MRRFAMPWPLRLATAVTVLMLGQAMAPRAEATRAVGFRVFCDPSTGEVAVGDELSQGRRVALSGLFPGPGTGEVWIDENCPERRCDANGDCVSAAPQPAIEGWFVLCNQRSGDVGLVNASSLPGFSVMAGPYNTQEEADSWVARSCPGWRCDSSGACIASAGLTSGSTFTTTTPVSRTGRSAAGVMVQAVAPGSHGEAAGFRPGDRLLAVNGRSAMSPDQAVQMITAAGLGTWLEFRVERDRQQLILGALRTVEPLGLNLAPATAYAGSASPPATASSNAWTAGAVETTSGDSRTRTPAASGGGWAVGELTTIAGDAQSGAGAAGPPSTVVGPTQAKPDVSRVIAAAKAAADACAYPTALANADHMAKFDPANPWLASNHDLLRQLASRQKATEQSVWQAASALANDDLKDAREITHQAADSAVSCQYEAVSTLLDRIDETIAHHKAERSAANRRAVGALLPGLLALNNQLITKQYGGTPTQSPAYSGSTTSATMAAVGAAIGGPPDPCTFDYSYPSVWNTEPICSCNGYHYDATQLRCVR